MNRTICVKFSDAILIVLNYFIMVGDIHGLSLVVASRRYLTLLTSALLSFPKPKSNLIEHCTMHFISDLCLPHDLLHEAHRPSKFSTVHYKNIETNPVF